MEIGSIYEINPETVTDAASYDASAFSLKEIDKYEKKYKLFTSSGREAIALALKSIEKNRPAIKKKCLLPGYMCDSVFFPFKRAGWEIHFYPITKDLEAEKEKLCDQIKAIKPGLIFIHAYYGIDTCSFLRPLLKGWQAQEICIMEDMTQSYYLNNIQWEADYIVGSLRKWYPVPDGGFVAANEPLADETFNENRFFSEKKLNLLTEKWSYLHDPGDPEKKQILKSTFLQKNRALEAWLDDYEDIGLLSKESMKILSSLAEDEYRNKRNANYNYLHENLSNNAQFAPVPLTENPKAAPLYFPIYAADRDDLQKFLAQHCIYAPVLWPIGEENGPHLSETERYIYEHILALPMDQRYDKPDMQRIVNVLMQYEEEKAPKSEIIGIRADANEIIATGHIMRCITIAKQLQAKGKRVLFFTADEYPHPMLKQAGMEYICLHTPFNQMEKEVSLLRREMKKAGCQKLLVDSYYTTQNYFDSLKDICKIIYIDDCFEAVYPVDMLINYNAFHVRFPYEKAYKGKARLLLGTSYVPLREEFQSPPRPNPPFPGHLDKNSHILISSGGGDIYNALYGILSDVVTRKDGQKNIFHVVVGAFNKNAEALKQLAKAHSNIRLHENVADMASLMRQCDIAISAAGTMLFELCAMQIPTVFFVCADNQQYDSDFFAKEERMLFAGDIRCSRKECIDQVIKSMETLLNDNELQKRMKSKLHQVTDGRGADRIAEEIIKL